MSANEYKSIARRDSILSRHDSDSSGHPPPIPSHWTHASPPPIPPRHLATRRSSLAGGVRGAVVVPAGCAELVRTRKPKQIRSVVASERLDMNTGRAGTKNQDAIVLFDQRNVHHE
jgi:hypothetical protein